MTGSYWLRWWSESSWSRRRRMPLHGNAATAGTGPLPPFRPARGNPDSLPSVRCPTSQVAQRSVRSRSPGRGTRASKDPARSPARQREAATT
jgi:hypothetical protein